MISGRLTLAVLIALMLSVNVYADEAIEIEEPIEIEESLDIENSESYDSENTENNESNVEVYIAPEIQDQTNELMESVDQEAASMAADPADQEATYKAQESVDSGVMGSKYVVRREDEVLDNEIDSEIYEGYSISIDELRELLANSVIQVEIKEPEIEEEEEPEVEIAEDFFMSELKSNRSANSSGKEYYNTVVYNGTFDNNDCQLVIPRSAYDQLTVIDGNLVNVGNSSVIGRLLYNGDDIDLSEYDTYSYTLNPISGSTSNVYRYGSYNYRRHYYLNNNMTPSISYTDMYGNFHVTSVDVKYSSAHVLSYIALAAILLGGIKALWIRRA